MTDKTWKSRGFAMWCCYYTFENYKFRLLWA